jgi:hypothetical protein
MLSQLSTEIDLPEILFEFKKIFKALMIDFNAFSSLKEFL